MKSTMKAVVFTGKDCVEMREVPIPQPGPGEALLKMHYGSICGTDLHIVAGKHPRAKPPLILGHEGAGKIVELGSGVSDDFRVGDRCVVEPLISCGRCYACQTGLSHICHSLGLYGIDAPGFFAEYVTVKANRIFTLPDSVSSRVGALIEPVAVAVHSIRMSHLRLGDTVCVQGAGPIGILTGVMARLAGATRVYISDVQPVRLELAAGFGLLPIHANKQDVVETIKQATDGRGADVVCEVVGINETASLSPKLCRVRGNILAVSHPKQLLTMDMLTTNFKEIEITTVRVYESHDFRRAIEIVSTAELDLGRLPSRPFKMNEAAAAFQAARAGQDVTKVLFELCGEGE